MAEEVKRRPFVREVPRFRWYFRHARYMRYMAREITCLFIGAYTLLLVVGLKRLSEGPAAYQAFLDALKGPVSVVFHIAALVFALYNTVTWFNVAPKALPVQLGQTLLPGAVVAAAHYVIWVLLSAWILYLAGAF